MRFWLWLNLYFIEGRWSRSLSLDFVNKFPKEKKVKDVQNIKHFHTSSHVSMSTRVILVKYNYKVFQDLVQSKNLSGLEYVFYSSCK